MLIFEQEDNFFDAYDEIRTSMDSSLLDNSPVAHQESETQILGYEQWTKELMSVEDRRKSFLRRMGFDEFMPSTLECSVNDKELTVELSERQIELEKTPKISGADLSCLSYPHLSGSEDSFYFIKDLDSGRKYVVHELEQDGLPRIFKEVESDELLMVHEFDGLLGLSKSSHKFLRSYATPCESKTVCIPDAENNEYLNCWRRLMKRMKCMGACKYELKRSKITKSTRPRVHQYQKSCMDFTALDMDQEIQAHKGLIRTMKFSPTGTYLASGGEDCVLRIWQIIQAENSCTCGANEGSSGFNAECKGFKLIPGKVSNSAPVFIPKKIFKIEEAPLQELRGHTSDILDLSWSKSKYLLTASKDRTVRLWKVGCHGCLKIFQHYDYVTCVQFNPVGDRFFVSGSIDGKIRKWQIPENRVIDWVDVRDIITAICYHPDGKGLAVGSIKGNCRFYNCTAKTMQLDWQLSLCSKKKSTGKRITGLQFCPDDSRRIMITSTDSRIQICNGVDVIISKCKGFRKAKSQSSATFTSDAKRVVSVGGDSNVYIWDYNASDETPRRPAKSIRFSGFFFSEGVSVAAPWPGICKDEFETSAVAQISPQLQKAPGPVPRGKNSECFSLGRCLFSDGSSRVSPAWPEEKKLRPEAEDRHRRSSHLSQDLFSLTQPMGTWRLGVVVTAGSDGAIRSFHSYGPPHRFCRKEKHSAVMKGLKQNYGQRVA